MLIENLLSFIRNEIGYFRETIRIELFYAIVSLICTILIFAYNIPKIIIIGLDLTHITKEIYPSIATSALLFLSLLAIIFILVLKINNRIWSLYLQFNAKYTYVAGDRENWEVEGGSQMGEFIFLNDSWAGILLKRKLFKDFVMEFNFTPKESKEDVVGVIFRAQDFDNYLMLQLGNYGNNKDLYIRPHIRFNGKFRPINLQVVTIKTDVHRKHIYNIRVKKKTVSIKLNGIDISTFDLPDVVQTSVDIDKEGEGVDSKLIFRKPQSTKSIDFINKPGRIGFRATGGEGGEISSLSVSKL